jgi:integrase
MERSLRSHVGRRTDIWLGGTSVLGVEWVELPRVAKGRTRRKKANTKQLRHTFAVRQLKRGQRPEEVARMLGHVGTTVVYRHYAPWVKELDDAHIRRVTAIGSW